MPVVILDEIRTATLIGVWCGPALRWYACKQCQYRGYRVSDGTVCVKGESEWQIDKDAEILSNESSDP